MSILKRKKPTKEQKEESSSWNNWTPGSGRKGWTPWGTGKSLPKAGWRDSDGRPLKGDGSLDVEKFVEENSK